MGRNLPGSNLKVPSRHLCVMKGKAVEKFQWPWPVARFVPSTSRMRSQRSTNKCGRSIPLHDKLSLSSCNQGVWTQFRAYTEVIWNLLIDGKLESNCKTKTGSCRFFGSHAFLEIEYLSTAASYSRYSNLLFNVISFCQWNIIKKEFFTDDNRLTAEQVMKVISRKKV